MSVREGVYYGGFIAGAATVSLACRAYGLHHLITLIAGVIAGFVVGTLAERAYSNHKANKKRFDNFDMGGVQSTCKNEYCDWQGDRPSDGICPRCSSRLK